MSEHVTYADVSDEARLLAARKGVGAVKAALASLGLANARGTPAEMWPRIIAAMRGEPVKFDVMEQVNRFNATYERLKQLGLDDLELVPGSSGYDSLIAAYERGRQSVLSPKAPVVTGKDYLQQVIRDVSILRGVSVVDILSTSRVRHIAHARQEVAWRMRQAKDERGKPRFSFPQIAHWMGGYDHSTIVHAVQAHEARMQGETA